MMPRCGPRSDRARCRQRPGYPQDVTVRGGDDLQVHAVLLVLAEQDGRPLATRSMAIRVPSITTNACPAFLAACSAGASLGARAASRRTVSVTYRQAVAVPTPNRRPAPRGSRPCAGAPGPAGPAGRGSASASTIRSRPGAARSPRRRRTRFGETAAAQHDRTASRPPGADEGLW